MRDRLPTRKVIRAFGWLFVTVVIGGVLGTLASTLDFPSLFELFLPKRLKTESVAFGQLARGTINIQHDLPGVDGLA